MQLKENEQIEDLNCNGLKIIQNKNGFKFGTDAVILVDFVKKSIKNSVVLDIGTGTGIISILLAGKTNANKIIGIDIQTEMCNMAKKSVELNNLDSKIDIINADVKNIENILPKNSVDVVVTNPPYQKFNTGITSENEIEKISRHEVFCTFEDICKATNYVLTENGSIYLIHRPERIADIMCTLRQYNLEPKIMRFVEPHAGAKPNMVLIKAVKKARPFLKIEKPLIMYDANGQCSKEVLEIYGREKIGTQ